jgi:hypothetical protein
MQNAFSDSGMVVSLVSDSTGRLPMFHLANGSVHVGLTDSSGVVSMLEPILGRAIGLNRRGVVSPAS